MKRTVAMMIVLMLAFGAAALAADAKLDKAGELPDAVPAAVKQLVAQPGIRVLNESGAPYVDVWLGNAVAGEAKTGDADVAYVGIPDGTFLGVWNFLTDGKDFRGHAIKAGVYTMRYALMPANGDHMGVWQNRDFVLLVPIAIDANPDGPMKWDDVVAASKKSVSVNHPAVFPMQPAEGSGEVALVKADPDRYFIKASLKTKSGAMLPIEFDVIGRANE